MTVVESCKIHSTYSYDKTSMFLCIHFSKNNLKSYFSQILLYQLHCISECIDDQHFAEYHEICDLFAELTRLYISNISFFRLEAEGIILQIIARLFRSFSFKISEHVSNNNQLTIERIRTVMTYVEQHFQESISLHDIAALLCISEEYFCRLFKKNMGISFLQYLNEVRLSHIYNDLQSTDLLIAEIMEKNGFTNQKLFNQLFKKTYGCTPSNVRNK